jgi:hypothetical protein
MKKLQSDAPETWQPIDAKAEELLDAFGDKKSN